jgi:chromosome segregation ATPase
MSEAKEATRAEICQGLRGHYERISTKQCEWASGIEHAINAYEREPALQAENRALHSQAQEWERKYHNAVAGYEQFMADANRDRDKLEAIALEQRGMIEKLHSQVKELERKYNAVKNDPDYQQCCIEREKAQASITALEATVEGYRHSNKIVGQHLTDAQQRITQLAHENAELTERTGQLEGALKDGIQLLQNPNVRIIEIIARLQHLLPGIYREWCRDPKLCQDKGTCPKDPTCAD